MMSSQKIEVRHTLKSKNVAAFCFSNRQKAASGHRSVLFDHLAQNFIAKRLLGITRQAP
jgi:hypothetical protein